MIYDLGGWRLIAGLSLARGCSTWANTLGTQGARDRPAGEALEASWQLKEAGALYPGLSAGL